MARVKRESFNNNNNNSPAQYTLCRKVINIDDEEEDGDLSPGKQASSSFTQKDNKVHFQCEVIHKGDLERDVPQSRQCHSAIFVEEKGDMLVFGGRIRKTHYSDELFVFSIKSRKWSVFRNPRDEQTAWPYGRKLASLLYDKRTDSMFMFGGLLPAEMQKTLRTQGFTVTTSADGDLRQSDLWKFDFITCQWTCLSSRLPFNVLDEQHVLLQQSSDELLVLGGQTMSIFGYKFTISTKSWERVDFKSSDGRALPDRLRLFSTVTRGNEMILFGGKHCDVQMMTNDIWLFNINTYEWTKIAVAAKSLVPLCPRDRTMVSLVQDDFLVVYGGRQNDGKLIGDMFMFSFIDRKWYEVEIDSLNPGRVFNAASVPIRDGTGILMFGGHDGQKSLNCVYEFKIPVMKIGPSMASVLEKDVVPCADIVFTVGYREFPCHLCIISQNKMLRELVDKEKTETHEEGDIVLDSTCRVSTASLGNFTPKAFEQMLMFMYGKAPTISTADEVIDLGLLASKVVMKDLFEWCISEVNGLLTQNNVFSVIHKAQDMKSSQFEDTCVAFIASHPSLKQHPEVEHLPREILIKVLRSDAHNAPLVNRVDPSKKFHEFLKSLRTESVSTSDLTIKTKDRDFFVHRAVLVFQSEYYATMFSGNFTETSTSVVEQPEINGDTMGRVLDFIYTNVTHFPQLTVHDLMDLAKAANMLLLPKLETVAMTELCSKVSKNNAFEMLEFTRNIPNKNGKVLKKKALALVEKEDLLQQWFIVADAGEEMVRELDDLKRKYSDIQDDKSSGQEDDDTQVSPRAKKPRTEL